MEQIQPEQVKNAAELIRVITRSLGFMIPLTTICVGIFTVPEIREMLVGGGRGALGTAGIFYYEGKA